jgi:hypothetical protein
MRQGVAADQIREMIVTTFSDRGPSTGTLAST